MSNQLANEHILESSEVPENDSTASLSSDEPVSDDEDPSWDYYEAGMDAYDRYEETWDVSYLDTAVDAFRRAVNVAPEPDAILLGRLGRCLSDRYETSGSLDDLERALAARQHALRLIPEDHPDRALRLSDVAYSLQLNFERLGELDDLGLAIVMRHRAVELTPDGHPYKPTYLSNLGHCLRSRFERLGELDDLEQAIAAQRRRVVELTPEGHPSKPIRLNNLGGSLQSRFERLSELDDLEQAIAAQRRAVELTPDGHPSKPIRLSNLGIALQDRFERLGELDDLEQAIAAQRRAVELTPDGHPTKPTRLNNLGASLQIRSERLGELDHLEQAIAAKRRAVELTPDGHPSKPACLSNLGNSLQSRFERLGELEDLEQAIAAQRRAVELTPDGHPDRPIWLSNLGVSLIAQVQTEHIFKEALSCFVIASANLAGSPSTRLDAAKRAVSLMTQYPDFSCPERLLSAHALVVDILPEIVWLGHSLNRRFEESSKVGSSVNAAVHAAINAGFLSRAAEWLEAGRSFTWSQILSFRIPLDDLDKELPDHARRLQTIRAQLQSSGHTSSYSNTVAIAADHNLPSLSGHAEADHHRGLAIEYGRILAEVRRQPGFEDYLRPKKLASLLPLSTPFDGPIVFMNIDDTRSSALIISSNGSITTLALPELTLQKAEALRAHWQSYLHQHNVRERLTGNRHRPHFKNMPDVAHILGCIWRWIVQPILQALDLNKRRSKCDRLPHVTWCPTGPLTQLPLHAAGVYDQDSGPHVYDFVVSSYTPSLSALTRSVDALAKKHSDSSVLVVTQSDTPGLSPLPGTIVEGERLQHVFSDSGMTCSALNGEQASTVTVRAVLDKHTWLHLACHGSQDLADPLQSAFALHDGRLSLADLMTTTADNAELAFLSACQTAVGDEKIPEESMHLAAGMLAVGYKGVIATMWSIRDDDAPFVVETYYRKLLELRASSTLGKSETGAAYALHEATKRLREKVGLKEVIRWAPFVHFGI
ncbi:TPR-like protein [Peniophora sp. CONT]|nr:TPR-like protein [Peniophora sp. CONT]